MPSQSSLMIAFARVLTLLQSLVKLYSVSLVHPEMAVQSFLVFGGRLSVFALPFWDWAYILHGDYFTKE